MWPWLGDAATLGGEEAIGGSGTGALLVDGG